MESPLTATREKPLLPKPEKAYAPPWRHSATINKEIKFKSAHGTALPKCFPPQEKVLNPYQGPSHPYALASLTFLDPPQPSPEHPSLQPLFIALSSSPGSFLSFLLSGSARGLSLRVSSLDHHLYPV